MAIGPQTATRRLFLGCMGAIYVCAFASLYPQIPGLYGKYGLTPVHNVITEQRYKDIKWPQIWTEFVKFPTFLVGSYWAGLSPAAGIELCCLVGVALAISATLFDVARSTPVMLLLWLLYLSVYKVGQVFLWFQWDILLLETGFLAILLAPLRGTQKRSGSHDGLMIWLVRWLLFRLMFASGIVKLTSYCPTWWGLTALNYHYESQCIPTPIGWYAHQFPEWFQKLSIVGTYYIEIAAPLMFFAPLRSLRLFSCACQVLFQVCIILTGNYNFFNALTIVLCVSLLDDQLLTGVRHEKIFIKLFTSLFGRYGSKLLSAIRKLAFLVVIVITLYYTVQYFTIRFQLHPITVMSNIAFSKEGFAKAVTMSVYATTVMGMLSLLVEIFHSVTISLREPHLLRKLISLANCSWSAAIAVILFGISLVSHGRLDQSFYRSLPANVHSLQQSLDTYELTHSYGLFRHMTGVGGRPEIIIEGANDVNGEWKEYEFLYKPGRLDGAPPFVAPHQPRLDWQMWFAALGSYQRDPWVIHLMYRLLIGQKEVLQLIAPPPFTKPPRFMRAKLYHYHYTNYNSSESLFSQSSSWWRREVVNEYVPVITWNTPSVEQFLNGQNYLSGSEIKGIHSGVEDWLSWIHGNIAQRVTPTTLINSILLSILLVNITKCYFSRS